MHTVLVFILYITQYGCVCCLHIYIYTVIGGSFINSSRYIHDKLLSVSMKQNIDCIYYNYMYSINKKKNNFCCVVINRDAIS